MLITTCDGWMEGNDVGPVRTSVEAPKAVASHLNYSRRFIIASIPNVNSISF